jgi:probable F420-dependent oxidoreductase
MTRAARYGIGTPGVTLAGGYAQHGGWEKNVTVEDFAAIAQAADRLGYAYVVCSEHVGIPPDVEAVRGGRYFDPLPFFGYLAAVTERIRFLTYVLVLAYNHPLAIAKRYGTLDWMSGGRVMLGVGVGSLKPEFDVLGLGGAEFAERGARGDDAIRAIRAAMGRRMPEYSGPYYRFSDFIIDPCAIQQDMPIWIGGRSVRSLRRAVELGDGWAPFGLAVPEMQEMIEKAKDSPSWEARRKPLELALRHEGQLDPIGEPGLTAERVAATFDAGATLMHTGIESRSAAHYVEQLEALAELDV